MAGYLPQNRGNRSPKRTGAIVSRKLKAAGFNISPAARKYKYEGIFVSAQGDYVSILVDLGDRDRNLVAANEIAAAVCTMKINDNPVNTRRTEGLDSMRVTFDYLSR